MTVADAILQMDEDDFRELVDRDLRRKNTEEEAQALRSPALVDRWHSVLVAMSKSVDGQLSAKRQDFEAQKARLKKELLLCDSETAEAREVKDQARLRASAARAQKLREEWAGLTERYSKERASTLRFKSGLDETLVESRLYRDRTRDRLYEHVVTEERNRYAERVRHLESALKQIAWSEEPGSSSDLAKAALGEDDE